MSEVKLRRWLKVQHPSALWVEASSGASFGVPDAYLMGVNGQAAWLELKQGRRTGEGIAFEVRPAQRQVMRMLQRGGICGGFFVALEEGSEVIFLVPDEAALDGRVGLVKGLPKHGVWFDLAKVGGPQSVLRRVIDCWSLWCRIKDTESEKRPI